MKSTRLATLFYFGFMIMELSYLYILAALFDGPIYVIIIMLLLYPFALFSKLALPRFVFPRQLRITLEVAIIILVILLVTGEKIIYSPDTGEEDVLGIVLQTGLCGLIWLLGRTLSHERVNYFTISFRLQLGILAVLVSQVGGSTLPVFLFFGMAPVALFIARWSSSFTHGAMPLRTPNTKHVLIAASSILLTGTALLLLFSPSLTRDVIGNIGEGISDWATVPQESADNPSTSNNSELFGCSCGRQTETGGTTPSDPSPSAPGDTTWIDTLFFWLIISGIILAIAIFIAFIFIMSRRRARRKAQVAGQVPFQINMISMGMLRSLISLFPLLLKKLWLWLVLLFYRYKKHTSPSEEALISVRALYRNLLRWADKQGVARLPSQTPMEHLLLLEQRFPQQQADLKQVVEVYLIGRYSRKPVSHEEFDRARKAWQRTIAYHTPQKSGPGPRH